MVTSNPARAGVRRLAPAAALGLLLAATGCNEGKAMGEVILFSAVRGVVTLQGQPVPGATLEREVKWSWGKEDVRDTTTTGADGSFSFPAVKRRMLLGRLLPHEPTVLQRIVVRHGGKEYQAWSLDKRNYDENGELLYFDDERGMVPYRDLSKPITLRCALEAKEHRSGKVFGICDID
jgi:hypothetical protein